MFCQHCGKEIMYGAERCSHCNKGRIGAFIFCKYCGQEIRQDSEICEHCQSRIKSQNPALHIFGLVAAVAIPILGGNFGGISDDNLEGPNTVDYIIAYASVIILLALIFINRKANKPLRIISIVFMSFITLLALTFIFIPN